jgi:pSer/pThr/pTyr-binding forkhead associated (FHA) protein
MPQPALPTHGATPAELQERIVAERAGMPFLLLRDAEGRQRLVVLGPARSVLTVGRRADNAIVLDWDERVSRVHATVELVGGEWTVADDGLSQNGTWLGPDRVTGRRRLADGDVVRFGSTQVVFRDPRAGALGTTVLGDAEAPQAELTAAQRRVLVALCRPLRAEFGHPATNHEIAAELHYSIDAVKTHLRTLFRKLEVGELPQNQKRLQLAERALRFGFVTERDYKEDGHGTARR